MVNFFRMFWASLLIVLQRTQYSSNGGSCFCYEFSFSVGAESKERLSATSMPAAAGELEPPVLLSCEAAVFEEEDSQRPVWQTGR